MIVNSTTALQAAENQFNIQKDDTRPSIIGKFACGSVAKLAVMGIAGYDYGVSKVGSLIIRSQAQNLTGYGNEAAETFVNAAKSLDKPFAAEEKKTRSFLGTKMEIIEGPTASSYVRAGLDTAKKTASVRRCICVFVSPLTELALANSS